MQPLQLVTRNKLSRFQSIVISDTDFALNSQSVLQCCIVFKICVQRKKSDANLDGRFISSSFLRLLLHLKLEKINKIKLSTLFLSFFLIFNVYKLHQLCSLILFERRTVLLGIFVSTEFKQCFTSD